MCQAMFALFSWERSNSNPVFYNCVIFVLYIYKNTSEEAGELAFAEVFSWESWTSVIAQVLIVSEWQGPNSTPHLSMSSPYYLATASLGQTLAQFGSLILVFSQEACVRDSVLISNITAEPLENNPLWVVFVENIQSTQ